MNKKTFTAMILLGILLSNIITFGFSENTEMVIEKCSSKIVYNNKTFDEDTTFRYHDTTYVPLRKYTEFLGKDVTWDSATDIIHIADKAMPIYTEQHYGEFSPEAEPVSLIQLIATPEKYDGKKVSVTGVINVGFEVDLLYLTKDDWKYGINTNSIALNFRTDNRLNLPLEELERDICGNYVEINGIFKFEGYGLLTDISSVYCKPPID